MKLLSHTKKGPGRRAHHRVRPSGTKVAQTLATGTATIRHGSFTAAHKVK